MIDRFRNRSSTPFFLVVGFTPAVIRRGGLLQVLLAGLLLFGGCVKGEQVRINWDLTSNHGLDEVQWPQDKRSAASTKILYYQNVESVRVLFPDGRSFVGGPEIKGVVVEREGDVITIISFRFRPQTNTEALATTKLIAEQWQIPTAPLDKWYEKQSGPNAGQYGNEALAVGKTVVGPVKYQPSLRILNSFDPQLPAVAALVVDWLK